MEIQFEAIKNSDYELLFKVVKEGLYSYVNEVFGWDDQFQHSRLKQDYQFEWFHWVYCRGENVGMVCYKRYNNAMHVHLLVIFPKYQGQGFGSRVMEKIKVEACSEQREKITLSSFVINQQAVRLYKGLGYKVTDSDNDFLTLTLSL